MGIDAMALFDALARETHANHYSHETIPGNGNAHDPGVVGNPTSAFVAQTPTQPGDYRRSQAADKEFFSKCEISETGFWLSIGRLAERLRRNKQSCDLSKPPRPNPFSPPAPQFLVEEAEVQTAITALDRLSAGRPSSGGGVHAALLEITRIYTRARQLQYELGAASPPRRSDASWFIGMYEELNLAGFLRAAPACPTAKESIGMWVEALVAGGREDAILDWYQGINGPYCVVDPAVLEAAQAPTRDSRTNLCKAPMLMRQFNELQPRAVLHATALMAAWFEEQYGGKFGGKGLGVWLNPAPRERDPAPEFRVIQKLDATSPRASVAGNAIALGLANHLPIDIPVVIEIELVEEGTDHDLWADGVTFEAKVAEQIPKPPSAGDADIGVSSWVDPTPIQDASVGWTDLPAANLDYDNPHASLAIDTVSPHCLYNKDPWERQVADRVLAPTDNGAGWIKRDQEGRQKKITPYPSGDQPKNILAYLLVLTAKTKAQQGTTLNSGGGPATQPW